jgi:trigger factor
MVRVQPGEFTEGNIAALEGKKLEETVEIDQPFPANHRVADLRNKVAHFKITLKAIRARQIPSLDDELAQGVGLEGVDTLEKLRTRIREDLEKREKHRAESELREALVKEALKRNDFEVPSSLVERAVDAMLEGAKERFARQGIDLRRMELDLARLRADLREQAVARVKGALLLEAIAEAERIEPTEEDVQAEIARLAEELHTPLSKVQQQARGEEARRALENRIREDKTLVFLTSNAKLT